MKNLLNSSIIQLALATLFLFAILKLTQAAQPIFANLPISGISETAHQQQAKSTAFDNLYPLVAKYEQTKKPASPSSEIISIDSAFIPKSILEPPVYKEIVPDYFMLLKTNKVLELQAITDTGAIINNRYYTYGDPVSEYAYPSGNGKTVSPALQQAHTGTSDTVRIVEHAGKKYFFLALQK